MAKITLAQPTAGYNLSVINDNFVKIMAEFQDKVMYRNNPTGEPNTLETDMDANSKRIMNLPVPVSPNEAARLADVQAAIIGPASANLISNSPSGTIAATTVQGAINEIVSDLSASSGASLLGFMPAGTGGTARTLESKNLEQISITDYSNLVFTATAKDPGDPASHVATSFQSWRAAIQAAFDYASTVHGTVLIPGRAAQFLIDDYIVAKANTKVVFEGEIGLGDYTTVGGSMTLQGDNIRIENIKLNNNNIYAGGSGQNGLGFGGTGTKNQKVVGGYIKNCKAGNNNAGTGDGGKGFQSEPGGDKTSGASGVLLDTCFIGIETRRDGLTGTDTEGMQFSDMEFVDCNILMLNAQTNINDTTGLKVAASLNGFYAKNCGSFEGVFQFSRASNIAVSNGIIINDPALLTSPLILGYHRNCTFSNIQFYSDCNTIVNTGVGTLVQDVGSSNNNVYDITHWGTTQSIADGASTLASCSGKFKLQNDVGATFFGYPLRNATSVFDLSQGGKTIRISTPYGAATSGTIKKFSDVIPLGASTPLMLTNALQFPATPIASADPNTIDDYKEGTFTPALLFGGASVGMAGSYLGKYTKIGNMVHYSINIALTAKGSSTGNATVTGLPFTTAAYPNPSISNLFQYDGQTIDVNSYLAAGSSSFVLLALLTGAALTQVNFTDTSAIRFSGFFFV